MSCSNIQSGTGHWWLWGLSTFSCLTYWMWYQEHLSCTPTDLMTKPSTPLSGTLSRIPSGKFVPILYAVRNSKAEEFNATWRGMRFEVNNVTMVAKDRDPTSSHLVGDMLFRNETRASVSPWAFDMVDIVWLSPFRRRDSLSLASFSGWLSMLWRWHYSLFVDRFQRPVYHLTVIRRGRRRNTLHILRWLS